MLQASDAYKELVKSNIRPKCEPVITVKGVDNTGKEIELVWRANNIKDLKYKRGIDPIGREAPYIELTWTEIYMGKLNVEAYPEKYSNVTKYMAVDLQFEQALSAKPNTWKAIFQSSTTWGEIFDNFKTWKSVYSAKEIFKMPRIFLVGAPVVKGNTITWTARDIFYFLNQNQFIFVPNGDREMRLPRKALLNERANFLNSKYIFDAIERAQKNLIEVKDPYSYPFRLVARGYTRDILVNHASTRCLYYDFEENGAFLKTLDENGETVARFGLGIMYNNPTVEFQEPMSTYIYNVYAERSTGRSEIFNKYVQENVNGVAVFKYQFTGTALTNDTLHKTYGAGEYALSTDSGGVGATPFEWRGEQREVRELEIGEPLAEDNPLTVEFEYESGLSQINQRFVYLHDYFNDRATIVKFQCLPNLSIETGDVIEAETNLYNKYGFNVIQKGVALSVELQYNGALKQSIVMHGRAAYDD